MRSVSERTGESLQVANANDYPIWRALALLLQGLARMSLGETEQGMAQVEHGLGIYKGESTPPVFWPLVLGLLAAAYGMAGRASDGLARVDEALSLLPSDNPSRCDLMIVRGDLLTAPPGTAAGEAISVYEQTVELAQRYGLRMAQLQAATRLAKLQRGTEADSSARAALSAIYGSFTEGFDLPDLVVARTVLETN
jgi:hypothetical protein